MPRPQGSPASASQRAAGRANLAKGRAKRAQEYDRRKAAQGTEGYQTHDERWASLISGQLTVKDLSDKELQRRNVADSEGVFAGPGRVRSVPSHLLSAMDAEYARRIRDTMRRRVTRAEKVLFDLMEDPEVAPAVRAKIAADYVERLVGKTPDVVHLKSDDWATVVGDAVEVERDLSDIETFANTKED